LMMLSALHEPAVQEIREFSFIDLTEEPAIKILPKITENKSQRPSELASYSNPEPSTITTPKTADTPQRLDMVREQPAMHLASIVPANISEVLSVSSAKGTRANDKISNLSAPIELSRNNDLVAVETTGKVGAVSGGSSHPQINLERKASGTVPAVNSFSGRLENQRQADRPTEVVQTTQVATKQTSTVITGPLANRKIVEKTIPPFPVWAKRQGVGANVSLQFTVMEDGRVKENVVVVLTSGSREWDDAVTQALKKWRFVPLAAHEQRQNQTGVITFQFVID